MNVHGSGPLRLASAPGRWVLAASILGSGAAFLETTVVNVALPAIGSDLGLGIAGLEWILDGYLLTLSALMLLGGSLGDVYRRRRVFAVGLVGFAITSALVALAPGAGWLVAFRLLQGATGALLVPNSLALVDAAFAEEERGAAIGRWAGWSGVSTALGPLVGGWLVDGLGWRWVFAVMIPFALAAAWIVWRKVPEVGLATGRPRSVDYPGAVLVTLGLAGVVAALISGPSLGFTHPVILLAGIGGMILLAVFVFYERRAPDPLLPLSIFRSRQFTGTNLTTLFVYAALSGLFFLLMLVLQDALGYNALQAGLSLLPINLLLLLLSPLAGRLGARIGPRWPMTVGALVAALGLVLLTRVRPGASYLSTLLPGLVVFGLGLASFVAPLTAAVLAAAPAQSTGIAAGVNNAVARFAGLLAVAVLPLAAGLGGLQELAGVALVNGYVRATWISAALCVLGAMVAFVTVRGGGQRWRVWVLLVGALTLPACEDSGARPSAVPEPPASAIPAAPAAPAAPPSVFLADFTSQELAAAIAAGDTIALVYTGSTEGSGPHLALGKHNVRAAYYAERIARELGHTLVGQVVPFGVSPEVLARYPGTITLRESTQVMLQEDIVRSLARAGFTRIVLLTEHGPNLPALQRAAATLDAELAPRGIRVVLSTANYTKSTAEIVAWGRAHGVFAGGHGGLWDTSELWFVDSTKVRRPLIALGDTSGAATGPAQQVTGDPRQASAALGRRFADIRVRNGVAEIRRLLAGLNGPR